MDTMYRRRVAGRGSRTAGKKRSAGMSQRERLRLLQLGTSILLFLLVFLGRGILPKQMAAWKAILNSDMNLQGAVSTFGRTVSDGGNVLEAVDAFWAELTGAAPSEEEPADETRNDMLPELVSYVERAYRPEFGPLSDYELSRSSVADQDIPVEPVEDLVVTAVAQQYDDRGMELPDRVSFQYYNLGLEETALPVMGSVTSAFGFRDHPVSGVYSFHTAVDIGVKKGTDVLAFADGTVRYIGENDIFGLYIMLDHDNGVSTFYAHCEKLLVSKGDQVVCGQVIAKSGETGNATGPHLHFSLEKDGVRLDPAYYLDLN